MIWKWEEILPELVSTEKVDFKSVQYANIVLLLVEAVKELKAETDALKQEANGIKAENENIKRDHATLKAENK